MPEQFFVEGRPRLRAVGLAWKKFELWFEQVLPKDWEPWDAETIRKLEEYDRQKRKYTSGT